MRAPLALLLAAAGAAPFGAAPFGAAAQGAARNAVARNAVARNAVARDSAARDSAARDYDVVVVGGTPGGVMAAVAAAREGRRVALLERTRHVGGLPANGLGATDIATRGATAGLFQEFVGRVRAHYARAYGDGSPQLRDASDGYHFEPRVAERVFEALLAEQPRVTVLRMRQFDADTENVRIDGTRLAAVTLTNRESGARETFRGRVFVDATYEGDLAAAAGAPYRVGREAAGAFGEPMAGRLYKQWRGPVGPGSTGAGDNAVQAYNYRVPLTDRPDLAVPIARPAGYDRAEYASLAEDVRLGRVAAPAAAPRPELEWDGIGRVVNMVRLPNGKTDANNQHAAFVSTDLPEENWPWPTSSWVWRDRFAERQRAYTLGLLYFAQNDSALPAAFRARARRWGLARDEYADNAHFPRQVYVREGRRVEGEYWFTARDALPASGPSGEDRPPVHAASVTASHYALDSHGVRKREPGRVHLDGFFGMDTRPYTVPYGVIVPRRVDGLLTPVPVSGTHVGFSTLRMEPCWMALGQAAGVAASLAIQAGVPVRRVAVARLQERLVAQGAVLIHYRDARPGEPHYAALQYWGLRGLVPGWDAQLGAPVSAEAAARWTAAAGGPTPPEYRAGKTTRGELLSLLHRRVSGERPGA